ncbi:MAG TPA: hypothetical protein VFJ16_19355 [Longimicrobium sp.]|nr:hypothetical protein [Longimicrobium sp.]
MRTHPMRHGTLFSRLAIFAMLLASVSGCSDVLAVAGLSNLDGYWSGRYDNGIEFYLDLDDDLYGRAGFAGGGGRSDMYVDGRRDGSHVVFYSDDGDQYDGMVIFEGNVTGADRIDGIFYLDVIPRTMVLHRR